MTTPKRQKVQRLLKLFDGDHEIYVDGAKAEKVRVSEAIGESENQVIYLEWREDNEIFNLKITEARLADAQSGESEIEFEDHEGQPVKVEFHSPSGPHRHAGQGSISDE